MYVGISTLGRLTQDSSTSERLECGCEPEARLPESGRPSCNAGLLVRIFFFWEYCCRDRARKHSRGRYTYCSVEEVVTHALNTHNNHCSHVKIHRQVHRLIHCKMIGALWPEKAYLPSYRPGMPHLSRMCSAHCTLPKNEPLN